MEWLQKLKELNEKQVKLVDGYYEVEKRRPIKVKFVGFDEVWDDLSIEERVSVRLSEKTVDFVRDRWLAELEVYCEAIRDIFSEIQDILDETFGYDFDWDAYVSILNSFYEDKYRDHVEFEEDICCQVSVMKWNIVEAVLIYAYELGVEDGIE